MGKEYEQPDGLTKEQMKELTALASSNHPFLTAPFLLIHLNDLIKSLRRPEKPTSISEK